MRLILLSLAALVSIMSGPALAAEGHRLNHDCTLFVEQGDSYIKLFGPDWLGVFRANSEIAFYNGQGKLAHTPEKLVTGTRLVVPKGTYLTEVAVKRLSRYRQMKAAAIAAIQKARSFVGQRSKGGSDAYHQGIRLFLEANRAARGLSYGFENYLEARRLSEEAIRCFEIDADLRKAKNDVERLLKDQAWRETVARNGMQRLYLKRMLLLGLAMLLFLGLLWSIGRRNRKERIERTNGWLTRHEVKLKRLDRVLA